LLIINGGIMTLLNRWFSGRMMKRFLLIVVFLLLAATIWFLGPFLGFGDAHPWQGIEARVIFLLLSVLLLVGLWCHVPVFILLAVLACAAIWVVGPFVMLGEKTPLVSVGYRVVLIALIAAVTLGYGIWYLLGALAKNPQLLDKFRREKTPASDHDSQLPEIRAVIKQGMQYVARIHRAIPWWKRFFIVRDRHDLPWYLVMGMPDAGKTAMIFSSGQDLPLPEQLNRKSKEPLPTRHCECIFSNQAVFLDTSGKYIKQDSETDAQWQLIVNELKKHRPVNSIHGVMLAFSTDNILGKSQSELLEISAVLRARLDALRHILGERFPVYVMITKLDQLCGFDAYFRHLTAEEREQIWGVTLPYAARQQTLQLQVKQELTRLEQRICATMNVRQQEEYDVADRKSMYALEQDFRLLAQGVTQVLENLFLASRYDDSHFYSTLRGVYFVSNCQPNSHILRNNNTVVQKWYHAVTRQRPHTEASLSEVTQERGELVSEVAYGRHYFLKQLLDEVIDKDIHLVTGDHKRNMSARLQNIAAHLLCMVLCVWLIKGMYESYQLNHGYLQHHSGNVQYLESKNNQYVNKPEEAQLALLLNQAQHLAEYRDLEVLNPELPWRYGLYTGWSVAKGADKLYQFFLQRYLLPQLEQQVSESLFQALDRDDTAQLYNVLKRYLMLYGEGEMDTTFLVDDLTRLWQESGRIDAYSDAEIFSAHLQKLFSLPQWRSWPDKFWRGILNLPVSGNA
jgi:type VI secretion system protein ImpL